MFIEDVSSLLVKHVLLIVQEVLVFRFLKESYDRPATSSLLMYACEYAFQIQEVRLLFFGKEAWGLKLNSYSSLLVLPEAVWHTIYGHFLTDAV